MTGPAPATVGRPLEAAQRGRPKGSEQLRRQRHPNDNIVSSSRALPRLELRNEPAELELEAARRPPAAGTVIEAALAGRSSPAPARGAISACKFLAILAQRDRGELSLGKDKSVTEISFN